MGATTVGPWTKYAGASAPVAAEQPAQAVPAVESNGPWTKFSTDPVQANTSPETSPVSDEQRTLRSHSPLYLGGKGVLGRLQDKVLNYSDKQVSILDKAAEDNPKSFEPHLGNLYGWADPRTDSIGHLHGVADVIGLAGSMMEHPIQTVASMLPYSRVAMLPVFGWQGVKMLKQPRQKDEGGVNYLQRMLLGSSMVTGAAAGLGEKAPLDFKNIQHAPQVLSDTVKAATEAFPRKVIVQATNETLQKSRAGLLSTLEDSSKQANAKIGTMVKDIVTKDKQTAPNGIYPTGGVAHAVAQVKGTLNVPDTLLPKTNYIGELVNQFGRKSGPMLSFENLKDIRNEIGDQMQDATGKDYAAMSQLYKGFSNMMAARADQLGLKDTYASYNDLTKKLSDVRGGIIKNLQNADTGVGFFKTLGDPKLKPQVDEMLRTLEQHGGLPAGAVEELVKQHKPLTTLAEISGRGTGGVGGRLSAVTRHPLMAGTAFALASKFAPISPFIMSLFAAQAAADAADQFAAARAKIGLSKAPPISLTPPAAPRGGFMPPAAGGAPAAPQGPTPSPSLGGPVATQAPANAPQLATPAAAAPTAQAAPLAAVASPSVATPVAPAVAATPPPPKPVVSTPATKPVAKTPVVKTPTTAYSEFGITLNPQEWSTPEDVINAKREAVQKLTEAARTKATAINEAAKNGVIKAAERDAQLKDLADKILKANSSIERTKSPQVGRAARDRLRKGAEAHEAMRVEGETQTHKEAASGHAAEEAMMKVDKLIHGLRAAGHEKVTKIVEKEWRKQGGKDADPAELAIMLQEAFNRLMGRK